MSKKTVLTDEQTKTNARLEAHMVYICPECGKAFRTQAEWRQHLNFFHDYLNKTYKDFNFIQIDERFHECQLCFKWVENAHETIAMLQYHYFMHLDHRETYRCVHCRMAYTRRRALNTHLLETHIREIEQYEAKIRLMKKNQEQKTTINKPLVHATNQPQARKSNDLLQKALMDIDLRTEIQSPTQGTSSKTKPNASEMALDRCLNAYEDIVRKEEKQPPSTYEAELDALCKEFFEEKEHDSGDEQHSGLRPAKNTNQTNKEVVIIEIDALGEDEVDQLKKEMKPEIPAAPPTAKRRRVSVTPERESDSELSPDGLMKMIVFLCPKCGKEYNNMDDWRTHVFDKHDFEHFIENSFEIIEPGRKSMCLQCNEMQFTTQRAKLQKHCFKHLPYRSYLKCKFCERTKTSMSKMCNHIRYNHQDVLQRDNKTQLIVKREPKCASPKKSVGKGVEQNGDSYKCLNCQKVFKQLWRFQRHRNICNGGAAFDEATQVILKHLQEGRIRMNAIWAAMKTGN